MGTSFEIKRQLIHLCGGVAIGLGVYLLKPVYGPLTAIPVLAGVLLFLILPKLGRLFHIHNHLMTRYERYTDIEAMPYKGAIYYGIGVAPAILLLETNMACAIIMVLSVGDSISTIVGKTIGRTPVGFRDSKSFVNEMDRSRFKNKFIERLMLKLRRTHTGYKTLEGFVGFLFSAFIGAAVFAGLPKAIFLAGVGAFIELLVPFDDNLTIPWGLTVISLLFLP